MLSKVAESKPLLPEVVTCFTFISLVLIMPTSISELLPHGSIQLIACKLGIDAVYAGQCNDTKPTVTVVGHLLL